MSRTDPVLQLEAECNPQPAENAKRPMTAVGRVALAAALCLAFVLSLHGPEHLRWLLRDFIELDRPAFLILGRALVLLVWALPLLVCSQLRDVGTFKFPWTWTILLLVPAFAVRWGFSRYFDSLYSLSWAAYVYLIGKAAMTGVVEELVFRGYAFRRFPESHPRLVVLSSAVFFTLMHLVNLHSRPLEVVLTWFPDYFVVGLSFGIIRICSGSLAWCMLLHAAVNAAHTGANQVAYSLWPYSTALMGIGAVTTLCLHPVFRSRVTSGNPRQEYA